MEVKDKYFQYPQRKYLPLRRPELGILKGSEIEVINDVLCRLSDMTARQISDYSHNDVPWLTAEEGKGHRVRVRLLQDSPLFGKGG